MTDDEKLARYYALPLWKKLLWSVLAGAWCAVVAVAANAASLWVLGRPLFEVVLRK